MSKVDIAATRLLLEKSRTSFLALVEVQAAVPGLLDELEGLRRVLAEDDLPRIILGEINDQLGDYISEYHDADSWARLVRAIRGEIRAATKGSDHGNLD